MKYRKNVSCIISYGELLDKISILEIKKKKIKNKKKKNIINKELKLININEIKKKILSNLVIQKKFKDLKKINKKIWFVEDQLREFERKKIFDYKFIKLARSVYFNNDLRAKKKNEINSFFGSAIKEVKSYRKYSIS